MKNEKLITDIKQKFENAVKKQMFLSSKVKSIDERLNFGMEEYKSPIKDAIKKPYRPTKYADVAESWLAEMRAHKPEMTITAEDGNCEGGADKAIAVQLLLDWHKTISNSENAIDETIEDACNYGFGIIFDYYNFQTGLPVAEWVDWKEIFIDPRARKQSDIKWIIRKRKYTKNEYDELFSIISKTSFMDAKEKEEEVSSLADNFLSELEKSENNQNEVEDDEVIIYDYYSIEEKIHVVISSIGNEENNKNIILQEPYILKKVPITFYYHIKKNRSIWGVSPIEKGSPSVDLEINMTNLALKGVKASLMPALLVDGNSGLTSATRLAPGKIIPVSKLSKDRKIGDLFSKIDFSVNLNGFDYIKNTLERDTVMATKMDDSLSAPIEQRVGNAKLKAQSRNKQVNSLVRKSLISSEKWRTEHLIDLILNVIVPDRESEKTSNQKLKINVKQYFVLENGKDKIPQFIKNSGASGVFEAKQQILKSEFLVKPLPVKDKAMLKEQSQKNFVELLNQIKNLAGIFPEALQNIDFNTMLEEAFLAFDIDKDKILKKKTGDNLEQRLSEKEHEILLTTGEMDNSVLEEETKEESQKHLFAHMQFLEEEKNLTEDMKRKLIFHIEQTSKNLKKTVGGTQKKEPRA